MKGFALVTAGIAVAGLTACANSAPSAAPGSPIAGSQGAAGSPTATTSIAPAVNSSSPIPVTAGTTYVASYLAPSGDYSIDSAYFASKDVTNGPLTAPQSAAISLGNGLYSYGSSVTFPGNTYNASDYWVDVVFTEPQD